jgi:signal transduction histidine kinase
MFSRIRRQLTVLYTVLTALALGGFALLFYFGFAQLLMHEQEQELKVYAVREEREAREVLKQAARTRNEGGRAKSVDFQVETAFVMFVVTPNGTMITPNNQAPALRPPDAVMNGRNAGGDMAVYNMDRESEPAGRFLWLVTQIQEDGRERGKLIVGRDLSMYDHSVIFLFRALGSSMAAFLIVSGLIGYLAAGRAIAPIRRSIEAQRLFAADASHELRTPLSVIQASLDVVDKEDGERLSPLSRQIFDDLKDEVRRMSRLTGNLLTLARADTGKMELNRDQLGIAEVAGHVFRAMLPLAQERGVALELEARQDVDLCADKDRITQLLMILIDNGIKFTPPGGRVTIVVDREKDGAALLEVHDTGIGLSPEDRQRIFERFYRVDKARSRQEGGAGLGLSIACWIVSAHGGTIEARSGEARSGSKGGSVFRVRLPRE